MTRSLTLALAFLACAPGRAPELTLDTDAGGLVTPPPDEIWLLQDLPPSVSAPEREHR